MEDGHALYTTTIAHVATSNLRSTLHSVPLPCTYTVQAYAAGNIDAHGQSSLVVQDFNYCAGDKLLDSTQAMGYVQHYESVSSSRILLTQCSERLRFCMHLQLTRRLGCA